MRIKWSNAEWEAEYEVTLIADGRYLYRAVYLKHKDHTAEWPIRGAA